MENIGALSVRRQFVTLTNTKKLPYDLQQFFVGCSENSNVAVAGAPGHTGPEIIKLLQGDPRYQVRTMVRNKTKADQMLGKQIDTFKGDVRIYDGLESALQNVKRSIIVIGAGVDWFGDKGPEFPRWTCHLGYLNPL